MNPSESVPFSRPGDADLLTGRARFGADETADHPDGLHVVFVRSPFAHAVVTQIDPTGARSEPGVAAVYTAADVDVVSPGPFHRSLSARWVQPLLARDRVRYVGEPVAVVVAASTTAAVDAAESVIVEYEPLTPVLELDQALAADTCLLDGSEPTPVRTPHDHQDPGAETNIALDTGWRGTADLADDDLSNHEVVVTGRTMNPRMATAPIEGRVMTAWWDGKKLHVRSTIQRPHGFRTELAELYEIPADEIVVETPPAVGGGFGGKTGRSPEERLLPWLARAVGRPVTWTETRTENLTVAPQGRGEQIDWVLAGTADGRIQALRAVLLKDAGAYPMTGAILPGGYTIPGASGCYHIERLAIRAISVATNRVPTSAYRGAGRAPYIAGLERMIDRFAAATGLDPADIRGRNLLRPEQFPYLTPTGATYDEADHPGALSAALAAVDYPAVRQEQKRRRQTLDTAQIGIGIACYNHMTVGGGGEEAAVTLLADGRIRIVTGTTDQGHGHALTWARLACDVLGVALDDVEVVEGSTALIGSGVGAVGSRSAQTAGMAIHRSGTALVAEATTTAASLLEAAPGDMVFTTDDGGRFHVAGTPARSVGWVDVAAARSDEHLDELMCGEVYDVEGRNSFPSGVHVAVVTVDTETGGVSVDRFVAADDAGNRIDPTIVAGQLHGGIAGGIGQALGEAMVDDPAGNLLTSTFLTYPPATADVLPSFELIEATVATSFNPLGVKGVGESGTVGATPAVHNAVVDALAHLGVDHLDLPVTPERVWAAIEYARSATSG